MPKTTVLTYFAGVIDLQKLDRLKKSGSIPDQEFARLRAKLVT